MKWQTPTCPPLAESQINEGPWFCKVYLEFLPIFLPRACKPFTSDGYDIRWNIVEKDFLPVEERWRVIRSGGGSA